MSGAARASNAGANEGKAATTTINGRPPLTKAAPMAT
jgi:hypothetical protein